MSEVEDQVLALREYGLKLQRLYTISQDSYRRMMQKDTVYPGQHHVYVELVDENGHEYYVELCKDKLTGKNHPPSTHKSLTDGWDDLDELFGPGYICTVCAGIVREELPDVGLTT